MWCKWELPLKDRTKICPVCITCRDYIHWSVSNFKCTPDAFSCPFLPLSLTFPQLIDSHSLCSRIQYFAYLPDWLVLAPQKLPSKPGEMQYPALRSCSVSGWGEHSKCESAVLHTRKTLGFVKSAGIFPTILKVQNQASVGKSWQMQSIGQQAIIPSAVILTSFHIFLFVSFLKHGNCRQPFVPGHLLHVPYDSPFLQLFSGGQTLQPSRNSPTISYSLPLYCNSHLPFSQEEEAAWSCSFRGELTKIAL